MISLLLAALAQTASAPIVVGTYAYPRFDRRAALTPLAALAGRVAKRSTRIVLLETPDALAKAICAGEVDVAMTNLGAFVDARSCPRVVSLAVLDTPAEILDRYRGVLLGHRLRAPDSVTMLAGDARRLRYSEVLPGSTSGALVQREALRAARLTPAGFRSVRQAGTHEAALADLLEDRADIAALAEDPWTRLQKAEPARATTLRVLWRSEPLPPGPIVCRASKSLDCRALATALLGPAGADVAPALASGWSETEGAVRFRRFDRNRYDAFQRR